MDRRRFLLSSLVAGLGAIVGGCRHVSPTSSAGGAPGKLGSNRWLTGPVNGLDLSVARGLPATRLVAAALQPFGGMKAFVRSGDIVVIKPNLAWSRTPETGACTSPEVLAAVIALCQEAGAREVFVGDHPCDAAAVVFDLSGAREVCQKAGVELVEWSHELQYREVQLPQGRTLKSDRVATDLLDCDVYINLPTLKVHSASVVSLALKNQMGCVLERQRYHSQGGAGGNNLHRNIVDLARALRPTLTILDATRALKTNGPKGPGVVEEPGVVVAGPDMVAVDAYGANLLGLEAASVPHLAMAAEEGTGEIDLGKLKVAGA